MKMIDIKNPDTHLLCYAPLISLLLLLLSNLAQTASGSPFPIEEATVQEFQLAFAQNKLTSKQLVSFYIDQIHALNPLLHSVIELNPDALAQAEEADEGRERNKGDRPLGDLHGIPVLLKDSIGTKDKLNTTCGSYALLGSQVPRDAHVVERLRNAGAVILGKASLSEWYRFRTFQMPNGWSARGGQSVNPYVEWGDPCGSSSGSAISVAANMVAVSLGTETDCSISCPSDHNSVVGLKPTVGLTSRAGVVPVAPSMDSIGPICRTVSDAVYVLDAIAGYDPRDHEATKEAAKFIPAGGYKEFLKADGLRGKRLGVVRNPFQLSFNDSIVESAFNHHLEVLRQGGATVFDNLEVSGIDIILDPNKSGEMTIMLAEFKLAINDYLGELVTSPVRSLADIIDFNSRNPELESLKEYGQKLFIASEKTNGIGKNEIRARKYMEKLSKERFEKLMKENELDAMVTIGSGASRVLAIGGYPGITVPAGYGSTGMPFGICFGGLKGMEPKLIEVAYAFEQATKSRFPYKDNQKQMSNLFNEYYQEGTATTVGNAFSIREASINDLQLAFKDNQLSSRQLVQFYIGEINRLNPVIRGVIEINPDALHQADKADYERRVKAPGSLVGLHGIPVLLKDNIGTKDKLNNTAGSFALLRSIVPRDAGVVMKLRKAGAIILGKASMSEWASFRSLKAPNGFSARGGQGKNPYVLSADPCGSSSGPAISVAANLVAVSLGTETDGSILCPSNANSVVGIKPTVGLTSRAGVIPVSPRQDTVGLPSGQDRPICRTVADAVHVLDAIVGIDYYDYATLKVANYIPHGGYKQFLNPYGLRWKRIGVVRNPFLGFASKPESQAFEYHLRTLRQSGNANINDILNSTGSGEGAALVAEFKISLNRYLKDLVASPVRSLADIIAFNQKFAGVEKIKEFGQDIFLLAQATNGIGRTEKAALLNLGRLTANGFQKVMQDNKLDALVSSGSGIAPVLAIGGFPGINVPAGYDDGGVPFGLNFGGLKGSEPKLIQIAYAFEQATKIRQPPTFKA
ncbi:hypothetical protein Tsubulata_010965 [Turnera subulata]|uniref:Amidase domain-containing protein n=1 Tax=Turnera subulata TaxID=218843 RepID=A0A9Q0J2W8_9ROSI|nr:hypothetical protein Tsubulata_010965 [Turnera subulata]